MVLDFSWATQEDWTFKDAFFSLEVKLVVVHGRTAWYAYSYSDEELAEVTEKIVKAKPEKAHVFFNNNGAMLANSRRMLQIYENLEL